MGKIDEASRSPQNSASHPVDFTIPLQFDVFPVRHGQRVPYVHISTHSLSRSLSLLLRLLPLAWHAICTGICTRFLAAYRDNCSTLRQIGNFAMEIIGVVMRRCGVVMMATR